MTFVCYRLYRSINIDYLVWICYCTRHSPGEREGQTGKTLIYTLPSGNSQFSEEARGEHIQSKTTKWVHACLRQKILPHFQTTNSTCGSEHVLSSIRHPSDITCCWADARTIETSSDVAWGLAHALTLDTLRDHWRLGHTGGWAHALTLGTASDIACGLAHALDLDILQGGKAFKENFQGGTHFSKREEPGYRKQRALECKKNAFPGGRILQRGLTWLKIKAKQA